MLSSIDTGVIIQRLSEQDQDALARFFGIIADDQETIRFFHPHPLDRQHAEWVCTVANIKRDLYFGAWSSGDLVGYSMLRGWDDGFDAPSFGVCIHPSKRGTGLGKMLTVHAIAEARAAGAPRMRLTVYRRNITAIHIYAKLGFNFTEKNQDELVGWLNWLPSCQLDIKPLWDRRLST